MSSSISGNSLEQRPSSPRAEANLAAFRSVFDLVPYAIAIHDQEGRLISANSRLGSVCGVRSEELVGNFLSDFLELRHPTIRAVPPELDRQMLREAQKGPLEVAVISRGSGQRAIVLLFAATISLGEQACVVTSAINVTELRTMEQQFLQAQKMEAVGRLAGGVAHDFNNLLTVINGYSDLALRRLPAGDPLRQSITEIRKAGERAAGLSQQLLTFSRKRDIDPRPIKLADVIQKARGMLDGVVGEDVEITLDLDEEAGPVMADPGQIDQILMNLAVNARDAMPEGGRIALRVAPLQIDPDTAAHWMGVEPGNYVVLEVSDTGMGMSDEIQQRIFEPFFTSKAEGEGTGLGLATVYGIVKQAEGWIKVESQPGKGTIFRVGLPVLPESTVRAVAPEIAPANMDGQETILVVEDQDEVRKLTLSALRSFGYQTLEAKSAAEGLIIVENYSATIDAVLSDVVMPGMNGGQLADRLRSIRPEIRVLFMSGHPGEVILRRGLLDPRTEYLQKPFTPETLAQKLRMVLGEEARPAGKVLVVDDEASIRTYFAAVLTEAGYEVESAGDGMEAQCTLQARAFDLVITDLVMPRAEGMETIRAIRQRQPELKVIAVSGAFGGSYLKMAGLLGANATLQKPVSPDQLLAAVRKLIH